MPSLHSTDPLVRCLRHDGSCLPALALSPIIHALPSLHSPTLLSLPGMPGLCAIFGLIPCSNSQYLHTEKPQTVTVDSEIVIGMDEKGDVNTTSALLHYFIPLSMPEPVNGALHFVFGKIASIDSSENIRDGFSPTEYDFVIDANLMSDHPLPYVPTPTLLSSYSPCLRMSHFGPHLLSS
jgi:hypothetical protein